MINNLIRAFFEIQFRLYRLFSALDGALMGFANVPFLMMQDIIQDDVSPIAGAYKNSDGKLIRGVLMSPFGKPCHQDGCYDMPIDDYFFLVTVLGIEPSH